MISQWCTGVVLGRVLCHASAKNLLTVFNVRISLHSTLLQVFLRSSTHHTCVRFLYYLCIDIRPECFSHSHSHWFFFSDLSDGWSCFSSELLVCSSYLKHAALLPVTAQSTFAIGHMLQTPPLLCERARVNEENLSWYTELITGFMWTLSRINFVWFSEAG